MNAVTGIKGQPVAIKSHKETFRVDETPWGYIVQITDDAHAPILVRQALSWFVGTSLMVAIVGLWAMPGAMLNGETFVIKMGLTAIFIAFAALCFWLASRRVRAEVQFDTSRSEIRSVARGTHGQATLLDRVSFDDVGSVFLNRSPHKTGRATLVLRLGCTPHLLEVAHGREDALSFLRDRIGADLLNPALAAPRREMMPMTSTLDIKPARVPA